MRGRQPVLLLVVLTLAIHLPGLWRGRILDDHAILDECRDRPVTALLTEGLTLSRGKLGDPWWIEQDPLLSYFRPLLLLTFKLPAVVSARPDFWQHLVNLGLHLAVVLLAYGTARRLLGDRRRALFAAALFASGTATLLGVQWISGRKEPLIALLLLCAFRCHLRGWTPAAATAFAASLLCGEQAVAFPAMVVAWDLATGRRAATPGAPQPPVRRRLVTWLLYLGLVCAYAAVRTVAFRGGGWPVPPYFAPLGSPADVAQAALKVLNLLFSLATTWPYVDKWLPEVWVNHPLLMAGAAVMVVTTVLAVLRAMRHTASSVALMAVALVSALPFVPLAALPFYVYTPSVFFAMAAAGALPAGAGPLAAGSVRRPAAVLDRVWLAWLAAIIVANATLSLVASWGTLGDMLKLRPDIVHRTARLLERFPKDRRVLLVDIPAEFPPALLHLPRVLAALTGRDAGSVAILCDRPRDLQESRSVVTPVDTRSFRIRAVGRPYFHTPGGRALWFFPEGQISQDRTFLREWYSVTIAERAPDGRLFTPGRSFFSRDEGIAVLEVRASSDAALPLVVGYANRQPYVLLDLASAPSKVADPPAPDAENPRLLLQPLSAGGEVPPRAIRTPTRLVDSAGPRFGLGPLLGEMTMSVPAFGRAYRAFLQHLDDMNAKLMRAGGGPFRMSANNPGAEPYARAIEALGGTSRAVVRSNQFGVTVDSLMDDARRLAADALIEEGLPPDEAARSPLVDLLALAEIAAVTNRVIPPDYEREWRARHPEVRPAPEVPPPGVRRPYWDGVRRSLPYMYHAGALPWFDGASNNPLEAFDTDHFFSHAWLLRYELWRQGQAGGQRPGPSRSGQVAGRTVVIRAFARSESASWAYELMSVGMRAGFIERTRREFLPGPLLGLAGWLGLETLPFIEAFRDVEVARRGALFGAALAVTERPLRPSDTALHRRIIDGL